MSNELQFYSAAKAALAKAVKVDEVKKIHGKAAAMKAAAKVAKDKSLEADAVEIRMRAERRLGELMTSPPRRSASTAPKPVTVSEKKKSKKSKVVLGLTDRCVERVRDMVEDTVQQMQRGHAAQEKFMHLFAALKDLVDDLERKALARLESLTVQSETVEESAEKRRMANAKLAETESA